MRMKHDEPSLAYGYEKALWIKACGTMSVVGGKSEHGNSGRLREVRQTRMIGRSGVVMMLMKLFVILMRHLSRL